MTIKSKPLSVSTLPQEVQTFCELVARVLVRVIEKRSAKSAPAQHSSRKSRAKG